MKVDLQYLSPRNWDLAPSTRFQGSKRKLLPWIQSAFEELNFSSAIDLMSGTGSLSYLLKRMGKQVITNDYLRFNYVTAQALIENKRYLVDEEDITWMSYWVSWLRTKVIHLIRFYSLVIAITLGRGKTGNNTMLRKLMVLIRSYENSQVMTAGIYSLDGDVLFYMK